MNNKITEIADLVTDKTLFCTKEVLTTDEVARYMGISKSYLYKLTSREEWLQSNRCASTTEINDRANKILMQGGGVL